MKEYTLLVPFKEIAGKKDTGRNIKATSLAAAKKEGVKIYGKSVIVIPPYNPKHFMNR